MNGGLSVPNIRTELMTMSATAVSKWAITTSHIDQAIGEILLHNTRASSMYITPLDAIPRRPLQLRDNMWTTGAALCASLHSRPYEPRERGNVRWCYEHFKSTIVQTQWDGDVFQINLSSKMSDRLPGIIAEGRKLRGTFCAEWLPYMTSTADGWLLDFNGSPYKLAHTSLSVGTAQLGITVYTAQTLLRLKANRLSMWNYEKADLSCSNPECSQVVHSSVQHLFWECPKAKLVWNYFYALWAKIGITPGHDPAIWIFSMDLPDTPRHAWTTIKRHIIGHKFSNEHLQDHLYSVAHMLWRYMSASLIQTIWCTHLRRMDSDPIESTAEMAIMMTRLEAGMRNLTRLAEVQAGDSDGHTVAAVLKAYVDCFLSQTDAIPLTPNDTRGVYLLFFDGGSRGNPGPGGTGSIITVHPLSPNSECIGPQGYKKKIQRLQRRLSESEAQMLGHSGGAVGDHNVELSQEFLTTATSIRRAIAECKSKWQASKRDRIFREHMHHERKTSKSFYKRISTKFLDNTIFTLGGTATCGPMRSRELADDMGEGWKSIMQQVPTLQTDIDQILDPGTAIPPSDRLGFLLKPIDSSEIKQAVKECKRGKAHGPDELGNDWYRDHCDEITGLFERLFNLWIPECVLPRRAIPTTIDVLLAAQQRATSDPAMSRAIALLLDFAKAYDSLDRSFLAQALQHLGFPLKFVHLVKVLHSQTTYKFIVNGFLSRKYNVTSGIRQGYPLAPLLFILALEVLYRKIEASDEIHGVELQAAGCATEVRLGGYADDTTIYLSDPKDIDAVFAILDKYGAASGLRVNRHKSAVLPLNKEYSSAKESALLASSTAIVNQLHDLVKQFVWGSRNGKPAKPWMKEEQAELKKMNGGLSVPNIRTELMTMSATAVFKWAITTSHIDQVIGEILLHNTRASSTYITPLDAIPRRPPQLRDNMWTTGAALCASLHSRPYDPRERDNVRWYYEHFKSTIVQTQWDGDVFQIDLSSKMSDRLPGIIAEGRKLRGTFCAEWLPYMTSTADGWLLDSNGSPYKLAHTSLSVGTAQLGDILRWEWIRPGVLNFIPTCGISGFSRPSIRALERLCATLVSNFPQLLHRPQQTNVLRLYNGQRHYNHEWHLHTSEATLTHVDTTLVKATHTVHSATDCDIVATRDLNGQKVSFHAHPRFTRIVQLWGGNGRCNTTRSFHRQQVAATRTQIGKDTRDAAVNKAVQAAGSLWPGLKLIQWSELHNIPGITAYTTQTLLRLQYPPEVTMWNYEKTDLSCSNPECSQVVQSSVQHLFWECTKAKLVWNYFYALWAKIGITPGHDTAIWIFSLDLPDTPRHAWTTIKRHIIGHKCSNEHLQGHLYPVAHMLWRYMSASLIHAIWCAHLRRMDSDPIESTAEMAVMMTRLEAGMRNLTRLAEAQAGDSDGHTVAAVLKAYVDCFLSQTDAIPLTPNDTRGVYLLFFDGGSRGNPGPGGTGSIIVRVHKDSHTASLIWVASLAYSRKDMTNNFAEYWGLIHGLREAQRSHFEPLYVIGDSALIISQQRMHRSPRQHRLARLYQTSRRLADCIDIRGWYHHYSAFNKMADSAANLAMDTRTSTQVHFPTHRAAFNNLTQDLNDVMH
ncbi:reverse transcriptase, partial [Globisporangium splendens]